MSLSLPSKVPNINFLQKSMSRNVRYISMDLKPMIYSTPRTPSVFLEQSHIVKPVVSQEVVDSRNYRKVGHRGIVRGASVPRSWEHKAVNHGFVAALLTYTTHPAAGKLPMAMDFGFRQHSPSPLHDGHCGTERQNGKISKTINDDDAMRAGLWQ
ncbi:hypothetical protein BDZ45DRAFT_737583 [Acephala macrosclerotiorum]|nr:hypothetical protein BDZ45DRAFT_737583 [Acephala macrosclerotiorum]